MFEKNSYAYMSEVCYLFHLRLTSVYMELETVGFEPPRDLYIETLT